MVLRITARRAIDPDYYLADAALELDGIGAHRGGEFRGQGAAGLGYDGEPHRADLEQFFAGRPRHGMTTLAHPRRQVEAFELLFAAPKLISLHLVSDDATAAVAVRAHDEGVGHALDYLEAHALATVRPSNGPEQQVTAAAMVHFTHGVSRGLDPHLHSHVLVQNLGRDQTGRFGALDGRGLWAHAAAADAIYRSHLLGGLEAAGLAARATTLEQRHLEAVFSSRSAERRQDGDVAMRLEPKAAGVTRAMLQQRWQRTARATGFELDAATLVLAPRARPRRLDEHAFAAGLLGEDRQVTARAVVRAWSVAGTGADGAHLRAATEVLLSGSDRGFGVHEASLAPRAVLPERHALRRFGPRPLDPAALLRWQTRCRMVEHHASLVLERDR